jgi:murein DD-endopeptidase MepM/ murein hydrolase activator NlpD
MPKLSDLLISLSLILILTGCSSHSVKSSGSNETQQQDANDQIQVNKQNNSIRINQDSSSQAQKKGLRTSRKFLFDWPVWEARMTRGFLPKGTKRRRRPHKGIDLAAPRGSAVMASHDGTIIYTGSGFKGYGKMIMIESNNESGGSGFATLYGHLDKIVVYEGKKVRQGEVIGALGNTGRSSGPHLHFEIRKLNGPIDPLPLLPAGDALTNDVDNGAVEE